MALGVTHQLPMEERHIHPRDYIEDSLCVRMGGRVAELLVYGDEGHGLAQRSNREDALPKAIAFLGRHLAT